MKCRFEHMEAAPFCRALYRLVLEQDADPFQPEHSPVMTVAGGGRICHCRIHGEQSRRQNATSQCTVLPPRTYGRPMSASATAVSTGKGHCGKTVHHSVPFCRAVSSDGLCGHAESGRTLTKTISTSRLRAVTNCPASAREMRNFTANPRMQTSRRWPPASGR